MESKFELVRFNQSRTVHNYKEFAKGMSTSLALNKTADEIKFKFKSIAYCTPLSFRSIMSRVTFNMARQSYLFPNPS